MPADDRSSGAMSKGLVVPLVQIGQHFQGPSAEHAIACFEWDEMKPFDREKHIRDVLDGRPSRWTRIISYTEKVDLPEVIHDAIMLWLVECHRILSGIDKKKSPEATVDFYMLVKQMIEYEGDTRYWGDDWRYNSDHWAKLFSEYKTAIIDIDENLLEIQANWGE